MTQVTTALRIQSMPSSRLRITRRGRAVLTALAALPLVITAVALTLNGGGATAADSGPVAEFSYLTVTAGQSLWDLAGTVSEEGDLRDVIADIVAFNGMESVDLHPGQRLAIPPKYRD